MAQMNKSCPNCGSMLTFDDHDMHATCGSCDSSFKVSTLMGGAATTNEVADLAAMFASFDSPESALVYLESTFANMDWDAYAKDPRILIDSVQKMVEKNNIKAGAVATTWYIDFVSVATPLTKKFEGLSKLATEMGEKFNPLDNTSILGDFDTYKNVTKSLVQNKEMLVKRLNNDIAFAEKLGLDADKLADMRKQMDAVKALLAGLPADVEAVEDIEFRAIPDVAAALEKADNKLAEEYSKKGINARKTYKDAVDYFEAPNPNKNGALAMFESIRNYKDSVDYIEKINKYFNFDGEFFHFLGRNFIFKLRQAATEEEGAAEGLNPKAKDKKSAKKGCAFGKKKADDEEEAFVGDTQELYEIVNDVPAAKPLIEGITQILTLYANKLFYLKNGRTLAAYDFGTLTETEICTSKKNDIKLNNLIFNSTGSKMFLIRDLKEEKLGCFKKFKAKLAGMFKKPQKPKVKNTIALMELDLTTCTSRDVIDAARAITAIYNDYIFYTVAEDVDEDDLFNKTSLHTYNTATGDKKLVLDDAYKIHKVTDGKIVYTVNTPNVWNMQLRVHDIENETDVVIEENIYDFKGVFGGRIFYVVGNAAFQPLFSNSFEGDDRVEVMTNVETILGVVNNWIYIEKKSAFYNKNVIIKLSLDGKEKINLCTDFACSIKITDDYFYYLDKRSNLCVVRGDGDGYCLIAENIRKEDIFIDNKRSKIYYLRYETVARGRKMNYSLYAMNINGHDVRKIVFDVTAVKDYDKDTLYLKRNERCAFVLDKPGEAKKKKKGDPEGPEITVVELVRFYKLDKSTLKTELVLTVGMPDASYEAKAGCGKKKEEKVKFIELPRIPDYIENRVEVEQEDTYLADDNADEKKQEEATGCGAIFNKIPGGGAIGGALNGVTGKAKNGCANGNGCAKFIKK